MSNDEVITYDPEDFATYPSVCNTASDVEARFGWRGGEQYRMDAIYWWLTHPLPKPKFDPMRRADAGRPT